MLKETRKMSEKDRRWFSDDYFDLIVWYGEKSSVIGFQLCYDKPGCEHAFTWKEGAPATHERIDSGESTPYKNMSPVLLPDGVMPHAEIVRQFTDRAANIDRALFNLVLGKLSENRNRGGILS